MKEPDLEEEVAASQRQRAQSRGAAADHGRQRRRRDADLAVGGHARAQTRIRPAGPVGSSVTANELGLWRATDGKLNALINIGPANPREFAQVTSTTDVLAPIAAATGGSSRRLDDGNGLDVPRIVAVRSGDTYKGDDWIGLKMREASVVRGIGVLPVFAGLLGLLLLLGSLAGTWAREDVEQSCCRASLKIPFRSHRPRNAIERTGLKLGHQDTRRIDGARHGDPSGRHRLKSASGVIRLVADQDHQAMALSGGILERADRLAPGRPPARETRVRPSVARAGAPGSRRCGLVKAGPNRPAACRYGP